MTGMRRFPGLPTLLLAALVAQACDSAEVRSSTPPQPTARATAEGAASARETGCFGPAPAATNAEWEQQVIALVNQQRKANDLPPLKHVPLLSDAARWYAKDMADDDYFGPGHDTYDRKGGRLIRACAWDARIAAFYVGASALAENIGEGYSSPEEVVAGWMGSSGHRKNVLNGSYWETGVGYQPDASEGDRWVEDFGRRRGIYPVVIDDEAASTDSPLVELYVYGRWSELRIRNDGEEFSPWQPFASTRAWSLATIDGPRTVSVEMRRGSTVAAASDTIELRLSRR
jgi:uncharacterized protein YkwD